MTSILFTTSKLGNGGAERQLLNLLKGIDKNKYNPVLIVMHDSGEKLEEALSLGIPVYFVLRKWRWDLFRIKDFIAIIRKHNIPIVHTWDMMGSFYVLMSKLFVKLKWINGTIRCGEHRFEMRMLLRKILLYFADYRIANTRNGLNAFGYKENKKNLVVYNGIFPPVPAVSKEEVKRKYNLNGKKIISSIGRFEYEKDFVSLINIFHTLKINYSRDDFILFLIGNGSREIELKNLVQSKNLNNDIIFTGYVDNVSDYLQVTDLFILLSYSHHGEGFPNVLGEAMYYGIPSIVSNKGGNLEIINNGKSGFLCNIGDSKGIIERILSLSDNRNLYERISEGSKNSINKSFSFNRMIESYQSLYESIKNSSAGAD